MKSGNDTDRGMVLSDRLSAVAGMVTKGNRVCDVGCDHGFVPVYLAANGISPKIIAMDINEGPLRAAQRHIEEAGLSEYIETRLSDGVKVLQAGEADTIICAGMGGRLMIRILKEGEDRVRAMRELILQPQSEIKKVREFLRNQGYWIADENMILEGGKYYPVIKALPEGKERAAAPEKKELKSRRIEDKYGPVLLGKKHPALYSYLLYEMKICRQILANLDRNGKTGQKERRAEVLQRIEDIEAALSLWR